MGHAEAAGPVESIPPDVSDVGRRATGMKQADGRIERGAEQARTSLDTALRRLVKRPGTARAANPATSCASAGSGAGNSSVKKFDQRPEADCKPSFVGLDPIAEIAIAE